MTEVTETMNNPDNMNNLDNINNHNNINNHAHHESYHEFLIIFIFVIIIAFQVGLLYWQKKNMKSFKFTTLLLLWVFPAVMALFNMDVVFLVLWVLFSAAGFALISKCRAKEIDRHTPFWIYAILSMIYRVSYFLGLFTGALIVLFSFIIDESAMLSENDPSRNLLNITYRIFLLGVYFGVLSRDFAEVCTDLLAARLHLRYTGRKEALPQDGTREADTNCCHVCLQTLLRERESSVFVKALMDDIVTLRCGHAFHGWCIRGWTMVGKKDLCPACGEVVPLSSILKVWDKPAIIWTFLLDLARYTVVWNPIIFSAIYLLLKILD